MEQSAWLNEDEKLLEQAFDILEAWNVGTWTVTEAREKLVDLVMQSQGYST